MKNRSAWVGALMGLMLGASCSSPTDETPTDEKMFLDSLAATSVSVSDVSEAGAERLLNPVSFLTGDLRDNWVYHLQFDLTLKTGDKGTLAMDAQFTDHGKPIPVPVALYDDPVLNMDAQFSGTFKGEPLALTTDFVLGVPQSRVVSLQGSGTMSFSDLSAQFSTSDLGINFNLSPLPFGTVGLQISQPDFGNWTGTATFGGTPVVHVVATNGVRTFDLSINLLTGSID